MTHRNAVVVMLLASGCGIGFPIAGQTSNAPILEPRRTYPHEVDYRLLTQTTGESCADEAELALHKGRQTHDPEAIEPAVLYERAKYDAVTKVGGADGLVGVIARTTMKSLTTCVTVTGRAYKLEALRAVAGASRTSGADTRTIAPLD